MSEKLDIHKKMVLIKKWVNYTKTIAKTYIDVELEHMIVVGSQKAVGKNGKGS